MVKQNRVTPFGEIVVTPLRGAWTGNRGRLHTGEKIDRFHNGKLWITCALAFRGRWNPQWQPKHYTFLYFHDEAVAFAAGHRPCGECRRSAYNAYRSAWAEVFNVDLPSAKAMNRQLHRERIVPGTHLRRLHVMSWQDLPDGTFVSLDAAPYLIVGDEIVAWSESGYGERIARPKHGTVNVITPPSSVAVLQAGYAIQIDRSATGQR